jgi:hypothetical protein
MLLGSSQVLPARPSEGGIIGRQAKTGNLLLTVRTIGNTQIHCVGKGKAS